MLETAISGVMSTNLSTMEATENLQTVIQRMASANIGAIIIVEKGKPVGIFTERDLLKRVVTKKVNVEQTQVSAVMTAKLIYVDSQAPLREVVQKMYTLSLRHMLVVEGEKLVGIFSLRNLLRHILVGG